MSGQQGCPRWWRWLRSSQAFWPLFLTAMLAITVSFWTDSLWLVIPGTALYGMSLLGAGTTPIRSMNIEPSTLQHVRILDRYLYDQDAEGSI